MVFQFKDAGDVTQGFVGKGELWGNILGGKQNMEKATKIFEAYNAEAENGSVNLKKFYQEQGITNKSLRDLFDSLGDGKLKLEDIQSALGGISIKAKAAELGMKALSLAGNFLISLGVSIALTKIVEGIQAIAEADQRAIDSAKELANQFNDSMSSINSDLDTLQGLSTEFDSLSSGVDKYGNNVALTSDEYDRYKEIVNQILSISPSLVQGYDAEGNALAKNNDVLREAIELQKEKARQEAAEETRIKNLETLQNGYSARQRQISDTKQQSTNQYLGSLGWSKQSDIRDLAANNGFAIMEQTADIPSAIDAAQKQYNEQFANNARKIYNAMLADTDRFTQADLEKMQAYVEEMESLQSGATEEKSNLIQALQRIPQSLTDVALNTNSSTLYSNVINSISDEVLSSGNITQLKNGLTSLVQMLATDSDLQSQVSQLFALDPSNMSADDYQSQANSLLQNVMTACRTAGVEVDEGQFKVLLGLGVATNVDLSAAKETIAKAFGTTTDSLSDLSLPQIQELYKNLDELNGLSLEEAISQIESFGDATEIAFQKIIDASSSDFEAFNNAVDEIQSAYSSVSAAVEDYNSTGSISVDNLQQLLAINPQYLQMLDMENGKLSINEQLYQSLIDSKLDELKLTAIRNTTSLIDSFTSEAVAVSYLAEQHRDLANSEMEAAYAALSVSYATAQSKGGNVAIASDDALKNLAKYFTLINSASAGLLHHTKSSNSAANATNKLTDALQKQQQALQDQKSAMEDDRKNIETLIDKVMEMLKQRYDDEEQRIESLSDKLSDQHDAEIKALEEERDLMGEKVQGQLDLLNAKEDEYKFTKELADKNKSLAQLQAQYAALELDDSEATQKRKNELLDEIAKQQEEIDDYQHDHNIDMQKDMLNAEKDRIDESYQTKIDAANAEYEKQKAIYDKQLSAIKEYTSKEVNIRKEAMALINQGGQQLYNDLIIYNRNYGNMVDADIRKIWDNAYNSIRKYQSGHYDVLVILNQIQNATIGLQNQIDAITPKINAAKAAAEGLKSAAYGVSGGFSAAGVSIDDLKSRLTTTKSEAQKITEEIGLWKKGIKEIPSHINITQQYQKPNTSVRGNRASGDISVATSGVYNVDEQGEELLLNKPASGRYVYLSKGSGVFTAQQTKTLMGVLSNPQALIQRQLKSMKHDTNAQIIQNVGGTEMNFRGGDVYINGMTNDETIQKFKQIQQETVQEVFDKMARIGERTNVKANVMNKIF